MKTDDTYIFLMLLAMAIFFHTQILKAESSPSNAMMSVEVQEQNRINYKPYHNYTEATPLNENSFVNSVSQFPVQAQSMDIRFTSQEIALLNITLVTPEGKEILKTNEAVVPGDNILTLNTTYLSPGIYYLSVQKGEDLCTLKVIIQ